MGILSNFFKKHNVKTEPENSYNSFPVWPSFTIADQTLANNETIFAAVSLLSNAVASAPFRFAKILKK